MTTISFDCDKDLCDVNKYLDDEFASSFDIKDISEDAKTSQEAISYFDWWLNDWCEELDYCLCGHIQSLCNFSIIIKMSSYIVKNHTDKQLIVCNETIETSNEDFGNVVVDEIMREYIIMYYKSLKSQYIEIIDDYYSTKHKHDIWDNPPLHF